MAISFNGTTDYIEAVLASAYPVSFCVWFRAANNTDNMSIMAAGDSTQLDNDNLRLQAAGAVAGDPVRLGAMTNGAASSFATAVGGFTANTWTHAATVCTSATLRAAFINGGGKGTATLNRLMTALNVVTLGVTRGATGFNEWFSGQLAEAAVWNVALTDEEIAALGQGLAPDSVRASALLCYLPLVRDIVDVKGNPLTISGTTVADHPRIFR